MSAPRWLEHFGLTHSPFSKDLDDANLWLPTRRAEVVDDLVDAIKERQHALLTGDPGVGKTCILRALRKRVNESDFRLTYCHNATLGRRDFYRQLCVALGLQPKATAAGVFYAVSTHIEELSQEKVHPVLLLDESHLLHQDVLDHLHVLANYQWDRRPLLSLVLVGLPELQDRLQLRRNRSLWSRIHTRIALNDAQPGDTAEYIQARLSEAGSDKSPFDSDAIAMLHEATLGRLRDIDRVATNCLKAGARRKLRRIDAPVVQQVAQT